MVGGVLVRKQKYLNREDNFSEKYYFYNYFSVLCASVLPAQVLRNVAFSLCIQKDS